MKVLQFILNNLLVCFYKMVPIFSLYLGHIHVKQLHYLSLNFCLEHKFVLFRSAEELYIEFNPSEMTFRPSVSVPKKTEPRASPSVTVNFRNEELSNYLKEVSERHVEGTVDFSLLIAGHGSICDF